MSDKSAVSCPSRILGAVDKAFGGKVHLREIIGRLQVQFQPPVKTNKEYLQ